MTHNEFDGSDFILLPNGRTDYSPDSNVGREGTFINLLQEQERREAFMERMSSKLADQALSDVEVNSGE